MLRQHRNLTLDLLLRLEAEHNIVPERVNFQKWKDLDASTRPPYCEEEPDGSLQFYSSYNGRPCRKLCDFEKNILADFYLHMKPGLPVPSVKDLECWRQQLTSPSMDLWEDFIRKRLTPSQKEERDESVQEWLTMMHDAFWHKERRCTCKSHLYNRHGKRSEEEMKQMPTLEEMIASVQLGRVYRKSTKTTGTPTTPSKAIKQESIDTPFSTRIKGKKKGKQEDEDSSDLKSFKESANRARGRKKTQRGDEDNSDLEPSKKSATKFGKNGTSSINTPTKKRKSGLQVVNSVEELPAVNETHVKKKSRIGVNVILEEPEAIEALIKQVTEDMSTQAAAQNKTVDQVVRDWSIQAGLSVSNPFGISKMPRKTTLKKSAAARKKQIKKIKAEDNDNMLRTSPAVPRKSSGFKNNLLGKPFGEPLHRHLTRAAQASLEDPFVDHSKIYSYYNQNLPLAQQYDMMDGVRVPHGMKPPSAIPQTPPPRSIKVKTMSGMSPTQLSAGTHLTPTRSIYFEGPSLGYAGPELTPSRLLHFDGLTLRSPTTELTPSQSIPFDGLRLGEGEGEQYYSPIMQEIHFEATQNILLASAKRKSTADFSQDGTPTKKSKSSTKNTTENVENTAKASTESTTKKTKKSAKEVTEPDTGMMGVSEETIKAENTVKENAEMLAKKAQKNFENTGEGSSGMMGVSQASIKVEDI